MMQNNLNEIISAIFRAATGEEGRQTPPSEEVSALFDRLSVAAQTGDTDFFRQLVEAEKILLAEENLTPQPPSLPGKGEPESPSPCRGGVGEGSDPAAKLPTMSEKQKRKKKKEPTLLMAATLEGKADIVRALIAAGADVNAKMEEFFTVDALEFAVNKGYTDIVKMLLDAGADPNLNNQNPGLCPILKAVRQGNAEIVGMLIDAGAAVKFGTGFRLLVDAAENSTPEIIQLLINAGCNVNTKNTGGDTPLTAACKRANVEIVRTLIAAGANVNKTGMHEFTPIVAVFYAPKLNEMLGKHGFVEQDKDIHSNIFAIVQMLVDAGANLNDRELQGKTPLMLAVMLGFVEIAKMLINAGADVNTISQPDDKVLILFRGDGISRTALHFAVKENQTSAVVLLLEADADRNIRDSQGNTPLDVATQKGFADIAVLLR